MSMRSRRYIREEKKQCQAISVMEQRNVEHNYRVEQFVKKKITSCPCAQVYFCGFGI